jgi:hypothetical protein
MIKDMQGNIEQNPPSGRIFLSIYSYRLYTMKKIIDVRLEYSSVKNGDSLAAMVIGSICISPDTRHEQIGEVDTIYATPSLIEYIVPRPLSVLKAIRFVSSNFRT